MRSKEPSLQTYIRGLHHVTATVGNAAQDLAFYTDLLGFRLVKKTVNFEDPDVYHFYYGNRRGEPGTMFTTFPYQAKGIRRGTPGAGQVQRTAFSVYQGSMDFWRDRLARFDVPYTDTRILGNVCLQFDDPSGLQLELVGTENDGREPWNGSGIAEDDGVRGLYGVTLCVNDLGPTAEFLEGVFGFRQSGSEGRVTRFEASEPGPAGIVDVRVEPVAPRGKGGIGTVHHVAFRIRQLSEQETLREFLVNELKLDVTDFRDRKYFRSIYFRIPGGVLFEVATMAPGFSVDEPESRLGEALMLPPWEEENRATIEEALPNLS